MVKRLRSLAVVFALVLATVVNAQVTTSSMSGRVTDAQGAVIGATVIATHVPSGTTYGTVTNLDGRYNFNGLRVGGPYRVEVSYIGYGTNRAENITLSLGENYVHNVMLAEETVALGEVVVTAFKSPILNSDRTGASTNINSTTLNRMPTVHRSITDFTRLTPQANGNSFAGRDGRYNNLQIDGANFNNAFGLSSNALPGGESQPVSLDAIEEVSVNIAPYDVRQTGFTGAGVNAVTRSGTNRIEGSAYMYLRPKSFSGLHVGDNKLSADGRNKSQVYGARIGAPIIENKLFFFGNFEYENVLGPGNNWLAARPGLSGPNVTRVAAEDLEKVAEHLKSKYEYDPGRYENYANNYAVKNFKVLAKIDWNINDHNRFTIRFNTMKGKSDQGTNASSGPNPRSSTSRISSNSIAFENANYRSENSVTSLTGELNSVINASLSNQFLATYSRIKDTRSTPGSIFPMVDIWKDGSNYMTFGTELFSYNNEVINNNVSVTNNLVYLAGNHTITGGVSFESKSFANSYMRMGTSYYRYGSVEAFMNGGTPDVFGITYLYEGKDNYARVKFATAGAYLQDKYAMTPRLNITAGLRIDVPFFLDEPYDNPEVEKIELLNSDGKQKYYSTGRWPKSKLLFSPRLGFNWDVNGDRSLQVRGGAGIFTGNIPFVWFTNMPTNSGMIQNTFEPVGSATLAKITSFNKDPMYWVKKLPGDFPPNPTAAPGSFAVVARDFKMPSVWRSSLGLDWKIPGTPLITTADFIYSKDINAIYQFNANRKPATAKMAYGKDDRDLWGSSGDAKYNGATGSIIPVLTNTDKGYSTTATVGVTLQETAGFSGSLFYTYFNAKDITGNPGSSANSAWSNNYSINDPNEQLMGYSQFAVPHRVVGNVSYRIAYARNFASTFSLFYNGANQGRFAYTYSNDFNQDGVSMDLLYVPENVSELKFADILNKEGEVIFTAAQQAAAFDSFVESHKVLKDARGGYVKRNAGLMPWLNRWDFKFMQDFYIHTGGKTHNFQMTLDILNVGNLLNKDWGLLKDLNLGNNYAYGILKREEVWNSKKNRWDPVPVVNGVPTVQMNTVRNEEGKTVLPTSPFRDRFSFGSTWSMQVGLRYIF
ncbi:MAG: carboxypeptidase regulatory-like domain-containing protein [Proteiniphilum sp.]|nr:carboxypeptidase regulatory-like domain-containing protein [Proteiniphilum sp.]MDD4158094.1 carboxypeptidase regulatory-like domain-containing protein [Proteiniphilum sp.]MDD4800576.1 carboxypeptidase regulatory-like domain-containing protein [Proteiniphilum sp.]